jgi:hypothetical protein
VQGYQWIAGDIAWEGNAVSTHPTEEQLALYFENGLPAEIRAEVERHLAVCQQCAMEYAVMSDIRDVGPSRANASLSASQRARFRREVALPTLASESGQDCEAANSRQGGGLFGMGIASFIDGLNLHPAGFSTPALAAGSAASDVRSDPHDGSSGGERTENGDHADHNHPSDKGDIKMSYGFSEPDKIYGTPPNTDPSSILQHYNDTCAIRSQEIVLRDFGINIPEQQLRYEATQHGWYQPGGGTPMPDVGKLMESHGVAVNRFTDANIFNISNELAQGHRVIVGVDSSELHDRGFSQRFLDYIGMEHPDHALIVSSIDTTDPKDVKVVLTDPGTGEVAAQYSMDQFIDAWKDSGCYMVSTAEPPPVFASGMQNFDYASGHVSEIGHMPYDDFLQLHEYALHNADLVDMDRMVDIYSQAAHNYPDLQQHHQPYGMGGALDQPLNSPDAHIIDSLISLASTDNIDANPLSGFFHFDSHPSDDTDLWHDDGHLT